MVAIMVMVTPLALAAATPAAPAVDYVPSQFTEPMAQYMDMWKQWYAAAGAGVPPGGGGK